MLKKILSKSNWNFFLLYVRLLRSCSHTSELIFNKFVGMKAQNEIFANVIPGTEIFTLHRHERRANPCPLRCCRHIPMESSNFRSVIHSLTPNLSHSFNGYLAITEINKLLSIIHSFFGKNAEL